MDGQDQRRSHGRSANQARRKSCGRHKFLPRPRRYQGATSETPARKKLAASPRTIPGGGRVPYPRIAWEVLSEVETAQEGALRARLRTTRSEKAGAELKDGSHRQVEQQYRENSKLSSNRPTGRCDELK